MKTLAESIQEYNQGKLKIKSAKEVLIMVQDLKEVLLKVYRTKGIDSANAILRYFNIADVSELKEDSFELFLDMCEREIL